MKSRTALILVTFLLAFSCSSFAKDESSGMLSYYPYIEKIHSGPILWHKDISNPYDLGVMFRAVIIKQETNFGLIIEKLKVSDEGGFEFVNSSFVNFEMTGDEIVFDSWIAPTIVQVRYGDKAYKVLIDEDGKISIREHPSEK